MSVRGRASGLDELIALAYGDARALVNTIRTVRRHPWRALLWTGYAAVIVGFVLVRILGRHGPDSTSPPFWELASDDFWICGMVAGFGLALTIGKPSLLGVFGTSAEALLLTRAHIAPLLVTTYLQFRAIVVGLWQTTLRFAYVIVIAIPGGATAASLAAKLVFFCACSIAIVSVMLPRALARGPASVLARVVGVALILAAGAVLALDGARLLKFPGTAHALQALPSWHPGLALVLLNAGDVRVIGIPVAVAIIASVAFVAAARDAYPELYELSLIHIEWRAKRSRQSPFHRAESAENAKTTRAASATHARWGGAFTFVWADALMFSRRVSTTTAASYVALAIAAGAVAALITRSRNDAMLNALAAGVAPWFYFSFAATTGIRLAPVLRRPLFWLGDLPLAMRLAGWSFAPIWRELTLLALALAGYGAVSHAFSRAMLLLLGGIGLCALGRAVGLAIFALLPSALDQRGPAVLLRTIAAMLLILPVYAVGGIAAIVSNSGVIGVLAGVVLALAESGVLVGFAAWRLAGRVDVLGTA